MIISQRTPAPLALVDMPDRALGSTRVANMHGDLPARIVLDDQARETHCSYDFNGPSVLTITTVLPERPLAPN